MRAFIIAAGRDSRIDETGEQLPECLVQLAGKPLIARQIAALRAGGVTDIGVVRGYRAELIDLPGVTVFTNERWAETGAVASLAVAADWLRSGPVIVSAGNVFYRHELVHALGSVRGAFVVAHDRKWRDLWTRRFADPLAHAAEFRRSPSGVVQAIGGKAASLEEVQGQFMGLLKFTPGAWQSVESLLAGLDAPTRDGLDVIGLLQRVLETGTLSIGTVGTDGHWGEITAPGDVALYERMAAEGELALEG
jgi:choline kinase